MRAIVWGRFIPPHAGHVFLLEAAQVLSDKLLILLRADPEDSVPASLRQQWLSELFPHAQVEVVHVPNREDASVWAAALAGLRVEPGNRLFTGDPADLPIADALGLEAVLIDPEHHAVPASSAAIRADPFAHWSWLPAPVRGFQARTICLHGPESTGKSTLAPKLAVHFDTLFVPEYGRTYCEQHGLDLTMADLVAIGRTHQAMTNAARRRCNRLLFLDTDPLMTAAWADMLFGTRDPWFDRFSETADLYLLLDIDLPWIDDGTRFFGEADRRRRFLDRSREELERRGLPFVLIGGPASERLDRALAAIKAAGLAATL